MRGGDGLSSGDRYPRPPDTPDGTLIMSAFAALSPSEQATALNRLGEVQDMKTEDGVDSTPNSKSGVVPPLA